MAASIKPNAAKSTTARDREPVGAALGSAGDTDRVLYHLNRASEILIEAAEKAVLAAKGAKA